MAPIIVSLGTRQQCVAKFHSTTALPPVKLFLWGTPEPVWTFYWRDNSCTPNGNRLLFSPQCSHYIDWATYDFMYFVHSNMACYACKIIYFVTIATCHGKLDPYSLGYSEHCLQFVKPDVARVLKSASSLQAAPWQYFWRNPISIFVCANSNHISGFRRGVNESCYLLGCYETSIGS
jgi:hypothetical protein